MRKQALAALAVLVGLALAAGPVTALEPGDLVVGVETDLYAVHPETGALELAPGAPGR